MLIPATTAETYCGNCLTEAPAAALLRSHELSPYKTPKRFYTTWAHVAVVTPGIEPGTLGVASASATTEL